MYIYNIYIIYIHCTTYIYMLYTTYMLCVYIYTQYIYTLHNIQHIYKHIILCL